MFEDFVFDLKVARKKSGLSQADCGHLINVSSHVISQLEMGKRLPTIPEICALSLVFGRSFEPLFSDVFKEVRSHLSKALETLPEAKLKNSPETFNRTNTLNALASRLLEEKGFDYAG